MGTCGAQSFCVVSCRAALRPGKTPHKEKSELSEGSAKPGEAENQVFPAREKSGMIHINVLAHRSATKVHFEIQ